MASIKHTSEEVVQIDEATVDFTNVQAPMERESIVVADEPTFQHKPTEAVNELPMNEEDDVKPVPPSTPSEQHDAHHQEQPPLPKTNTKLRSTPTKPASASLDAKRQADRAYVPKPQFGNIRYHEDRIKEHEDELRLAMETDATSGGHQSAYANFHPGKGQSMASVVARTAVPGIAPSMHRSTIGATPVLPTAMRVHPRGFKMLSAGSPIERKMKNYFRLPNQPPLRVQEEHAKLRASIRADIIHKEQQRIRQADKRDAHTSQFGGTSNAPDVSTTVTVTVKKAGGLEETFTEEIVGKQLDGYLLLENATKHIDQRAYKSLSEKVQRRAHHERVRRERQAQREEAQKVRDDGTFLTGTGHEKLEDDQEEESPESSEESEDEVDATLRKSLLEHTGKETVPSPESAVECTLNDRRLVSAVEVDLTFFTNLTFLDVGENRLLLSDVRGIPNIEEIHLHCNDLTQLSDLVGEEGDEVGEGTYFQRLHTLNLSFNRIPSQELTYLCALPALQCLDMSHNKLRGLSVDFAAAVPLLTHLSLESNGLQSGLQVFTILSQLPSLTEVNLNHNRIEALPSTTEILAHLHGEDHNDDEEVSDANLFPCLAVLGLAHNKLEFFEDILPVVQYPAVARLALWGNPLVRKSKDVNSIKRELVDAVGIECLFDHPVPSKRSTQDFYSTRPPARDPNGKKKRRQDGRDTQGLGGAGEEDPEIANARLVLHSTVNNIFNPLDKPQHGASQRQQYLDAAKLRGPNGRVLQLPDSIHADHQLRSMKSLGLSRTTDALKHTPGTGPGLHNLETKRKILKQESKALKNLFNPNRPLSTHDIPQEKRPKEFNGSVSRPPAGPSSYTASTKSASERKVAHERDFPLPTIPTTKPLSSTAMELPTDTRSAMAELRRMIRKPLPPLH